MPLAGGPLIARHVWARILILAALFIPLHYDILNRLARIAASDGDWSHAFLIPFISLYFIYQRRDELRALEPRTCWWALLIVLAGLGGFLASIYPVRNDMLKGYSMILELFGIVMLLVGPRMMKVLWFPIFYLVFAVKVTDRLWEMIAGQLQLIAARSSVVILKLMGIDAEVTGTTIELWDGLTKMPPLNVAEACSGLRMLMTFIALGVAMAYLWERPWWARLTLVLMTVPIAIVVNVGRVTVLGVVHIYAPQYAQGDFHIFIGMLMLVPAGILFWGLGWVLNQVVHPEAKPA